ncbi:hypothetical protein P879_10431, partial [Paragonimus westermani]
MRANDAFISSTFEAVLQSSYEELVRSSWNGISKEMQVAYSKSPVKYLLMEERNVYCGVHNVFVLYERGSDEKLCKKRVVHTDGGRAWLAHCEGTPENRTIRFVNIASRFEDKEPENSLATDVLTHLSRLRLVGHAGSVRALWLDTEYQLLLSGSYDTSIRLWDLRDRDQIPNLSNGTTNSSNKCVRIYRGHTASVLCIWLDGTTKWQELQPSKRVNKCDQRPPADSLTGQMDRFTLRFASGGADNNCFVWRLDSRDHLWLMQHEVHVTAVLLRGSLCASGDRSGKIRLWQLSGFKPTLQKTMDGHSDSVSALRMNEAHLVSASRDGFVRIWSLTDDLTSCLGQLPHP